MTKERAKPTRVKATRIPKIEMPHENGMRYMKELKPVTIQQNHYYQLIKEKKLIIVISKAGCGKTCLASRYAVQELIKKNYDKIIITRPNIGAEINELGHLPGSVVDKMGMFIRPVLDELIHYGLTNQEIIQKIDDNIIEIIPFFYMQGRSFINSIIIAEEVQNCTYDQIILLLTIHYWDFKNTEDILIKELRISI